MHPQTSSLLVPAALGLLGAVLVLASIVVPALGLLTMPVAVAPLFYAGLTRNVRGAAIASGVALLATGLFAGPGGLAVVALIGVGPAFLVAWYANLSRPVDEDDPGGPVEWFPLGGILVRLVLYVALVVVLIVAVTGYDPVALSGELNVAIRNIFDEAARQNPDLTMPDDDRIAAQTSLFVRLAPGLMPAGLLLMLVASLAVASAIARARGSQRRGRDDVAAQANLPAAAVAAFAVAVACLALGVLATTALAVTGALAFAFALIGLAVIHYAMRGRPTRMATLTLLYIALIIFSPLWIGLVLLGLAETLLGLRARLANRST